MFVTQEQVTLHKFVRVVSLWYFLIWPTIPTTLMVKQYYALAYRLLSYSTFGWLRSSYLWYTITLCHWTVTDQYSGWVGICSICERLYNQIQVGSTQDSKISGSSLIAGDVSIYMKYSCLECKSPFNQSIFNILVIERCDWQEFVHHHSMPLNCNYGDHICDQKC